MNIIPQKHLAINPCLNCNEYFYTNYLYETKTRKFCSVICSQEWHCRKENTLKQFPNLEYHPPKKHKTCIECNKKYVPNSSGQRWCAFCNKTLGAKKYTAENTCINCGKKFKVRDLGQIKNQKFCSSSCVGSWRRDNNLLSNDFINSNYVPPKYKKVCRRCDAIFDPNSAIQEWCINCNPSKRDSSLLKKYGINQEDFNLKVKNQNGLCSICLVNNPVVVDHCHKTGKIRDILCISCNIDLGILENYYSKDWFETATRYITTNSIENIVFNNLLPLGSNQKRCSHCLALYVPRSIKQRWCKQCVPSDKYRDMMKKYNIGKREWDTQYIKQEKKCALCQSFEKELFVDHCHSSNTIRGLLCVTCNINIRLLDKGFDWINKAKEYIIHFT